MTESTREPAEVAAWVRLTATPGVSAQTGRRLLAAFGLPQAVLAQDAARLREVVEPAVAGTLCAVPDAATSARIARTLQWLDMPGHSLVTMADAAYPPRLLDLADPPLLLYINGNVARLHGQSLGMVGARQATVQGARDAHAFASAFSGAGLTVVSGLALGIDAAAHAAALDGLGGTVAVVGTGVDIVYPARHHTLAHQIIAAGGAIVSEFPLGTPARPNHFPRRNRIIAALARGVLVVEAAERSGSLITARLASEMGREVFAIPGSIHAELARGCHKLIRQGAKLVESPADVLEEFADLARLPGPACAPEADHAPATASASRDVFLAALAYDPVTLDGLCERTGIAAAEVSATLLQMELDGAVERLPGNRFRRLA